MGTCIVSFKLPASTIKYDLVVSTYQMCILNLFNYNEELTNEEIAEHMGFDEETTKKNVSSLTLKTARIL